MCADDSDARKEFSRMLGGRALHVADALATDSTERAFAEFFALSLAHTIVLSNKWSTFSSVACFLGVPCDFHIAWPDPERHRALQQQALPWATLYPRALYRPTAHATPSKHGRRRAGESAGGKQLSWVKGRSVHVLLILSGLAVIIIAVLTNTEKIKAMRPFMGVI